LNFDSVVREINKINERELELGISGSWHDEYKGESRFVVVFWFLTRACLDSAYVFIGGLHFDLTEGDVITIFSQCVNYSGYLNVIEPLGKVWGSYGR
jgi:RNA-binding motif X-linked protein 2